MTKCVTSFSQTRQNYISHFFVAKDVLDALYLQDGVLQFKKWVCHTGGETCKRRLVHDVALIIMA